MSHDSWHMNTSSSISAPKVSTDMQLLQALVYAKAYNWRLSEVCNIEGKVTVFVGISAFSLVVIQLQLATMAASFNFI